VATVQGFAKQEQAVIKEVTDARAALGGARNPAEKIAANGQLDGALSRLLVVVENYPQLKSNENFLRLQDELAGSENRIAIERRKYNETVQRYNTDIELFPNNIAASMFGFQRNDAYFKTEPGARNAPKVSF
jgi:LemA protein